MLQVSTWEKVRSNLGACVFVSVFKWKGKEWIHRWQTCEGKQFFLNKPLPPSPPFHQKPNSRIETKRAQWYLPGGGSHYSNTGEYNSKVPRRKENNFFHPVWARCINQKPAACWNPVLFLHGSQSIPREMESQVYYVNFLFMSKHVTSCLLREFFYWKAVPYSLFS